jgi:hypothetical protein
MPDKWSQYAQPADKWAQYATQPSEDDHAGQGSSPNYGPNVTVADPTMGQIGKGVLREGAQLLSGAHGIGKALLEKIPGVSGSPFDNSMQQHQATLDRMAQPQNIGEAMGKTGGEMASYLAPAKLETGAAEMAPKAWRPLARIVGGGLSQGTMSKMNGGDFTTGALTGAGFGALSEGARAVLAPALVRSAIPGNITREVAKAVLNETSGIRPSKVLNSVENRIGRAGSDLNTAVGSSQSQVPLQPAMQPINGLKRTAADLGVPELDEKANELRDWLHGNAVTGQQYGASVDPRTALNIRRGGNEMFGGNRVWKQVANPRAQGAFKQAYGALTNSLHEAAPGTIEPDEVMHNLLPAQTGLRTIVRNDPSIATNVMGRFMARTGALTSMVGGALEGGKAGGVPGALAGGTIGLIAPEAISAPTAKFAMARTLHSTATPKIARALTSPLIENLRTSFRKKE